MSSARGSSSSKGKEPASARSLSASVNDGGDSDSDHLSDASSSGYDSPDARDTIKKVPIPAELRVWREDKRVVHFLVKIGEARNARRVFDENEVDFETLLILTDDMLADMGLKLSSREKILKGVAKIKEEADDRLALYDDDDDAAQPDPARGDDGIDAKTQELIDLLSSPKHKELSIGLRRLRELAQADPNLLSRSQVVTKLHEVLRGGSTWPSLGKPQKEALGIIYILSKVDANKGMLQRVGLIGSLADILNIASEERSTKVALVALKTLQEMMSTPTNLKEVRETSSLMTSLLRLTGLSAPGVQESALEVLWTMAFENALIQEGILNRNGVTIIGSLIIDTDHPDNFKVKGLAARTLGVLASGAIANRAVQDHIKTNVIQLLVQMTLSPDEYQQMGGASAIGYLCDANADKKAVVLRMNAVEHMVQLLSSPNLDVQQAAALAVRGLTRRSVAPTRKKLGMSSRARKQCDAAVRKVLYDSGAVLSLASLLHSGKKAMREDALAALFELGRENSAVQDQIFQSVNAPPLVEVLSDSSVNIQYYALGLIFFLISGNAPRAHTFLRAGLLEPIHRLQASQNATINNGAVQVFLELQKGNASLLNYASYAWS